MAVKFNPFTGQLQIDEKGSGGGGAQYLDGEVATYNDLPLDGTAAADSAWLVRSASGTWLVGRKPAGIYIRTATAGVSRDADYTYAGIFPDVFSDANFTLYDDGDATKTAQFQLSGITTGTNRVVSLPDKNITLDDAGDARTPTAHTHELAALDATGATDGHVLTADGAGGAAWEAASGGVSAIGASAADILSVSGSDLVADDPNADRLVMYDDSASKLTHATAGKGLSFDGTTLKSATAFPDVHISRGATYISYIGGAALTGNSSNITNTGPGYVVFSPVYVRASANYTTFSVIVAAAGSASSVGKMALYTIKPADATPDALVCESGTFAADSTGLKQPTMASTFVSEGWYYMAIGTDSTTNMSVLGDTMQLLRCVFSGTASTTPFLLDFSSKSYADLWPNPWNGVGTTFRNAYHPVTSLT